MKFSDRIRLLRERLHLTQAEFGRLLGIENSTTISRWENGHYESTTSACTEKLIQLLERAPDAALSILSDLPYDATPEPWADRVEHIKAEFNLSDERLANILGLSFQVYSDYRISKLPPNACTLIMTLLLERKPDLVAPDIRSDGPSGRDFEWTSARIQEVRRSLNLNQHELADLLNVNYPVEKTWETVGKNPGPCARILLGLLEQRGTVAADLMVDTPLVEDWSVRRLKSLRKSLNLTMDEFSVLVGMSYGAVGSWFYRGVKGGCAARLLSLLEAHPELFKDIV